MKKAIAFSLTCLLLAGSSFGSISAKSLSKTITPQSKQKSENRKRESKQEKNAAKHRVSSQRQQKTNARGISLTHTEKIVALLGSLGVCILLFIGYKLSRNPSTGTENARGNSSASIKRATFGNQSTISSNAPSQTTTTDTSNEPEQTFAFIKPDAHKKAIEIMDSIRKQGFVIVKNKNITLSEKDAKLFYIEHKNKPFYNRLVNHMTSGSAVAMVLQSKDAIKKWKEVMGPSDPNEAKEKAPASLRAQLGKDFIRNALHGSDSALDAEREIDFFFGDD